MVLINWEKNMLFFFFLVQVAPTLLLVRPPNSLYPPPHLNQLRPWTKIVYGAGDL